MDREEYERQYNEYVRIKNDTAAQVRRLEQLEIEINRAIAENKRLQIDVGECQDDTVLATKYVNSLGNNVFPSINDKSEKLNITGGKEHDCISVLDELDNMYKKFKNQSSASKEMTKLVTQYYQKFGEYEKVRNIALGYVVGVDENIWVTDTPRKTVEKTYLANTSYWLSYAMMATMLWASNEEEAAQRAVKQALAKDPKKTALYFMLVNLRFERTDAARQWYEVYMKQLDEENITEEFQYILQALFSGCFGRDTEFERVCMDKISELLRNAFERDKHLGDKLAKDVCDRYHAIVNETRKQYTMMGRSVKDYGDMISLLSEAEKNAIILDRYKYATEKKGNSKSLSVVIEETLASLLSAYDDEEKEHLDRIKYNEAIMKAQGNLSLAEELFKQQMALEKRAQNIGFFLVDMAVSTDENINILVRKFALRLVGKYCRDGAKMFADNYRKSYENEHEYAFDGWKYKSDENAYDEASKSLRTHYDKLIKEKIRNDKTVKSGLLISVIGFVVMAIVGLIIGFNISNMEPNQIIFGIVITAIIGGIGVAGIMMMSYQKRKITDANREVIKNGLHYLKLVLEDIKQWKLDYKVQDANNQKIIDLLN